MNDPIQRCKVLTAGVLNLILVMGIARFAYTPLLPAMQEQTDLGAAEGGWLAAINYLGYLVGAVVASVISDLELKDRLYRIGLVAAVVTTAGMGLTENLWLWAILRFFAGLSCAAGMLIGSGLVLNWLMRNNHRGELGIQFSGVGLGMALCAVAVEVMNTVFDWREQWFVLTAIGALILIPAWVWLPRPESIPSGVNRKTMEDSPPGAIFMRLVTAAYFCAGVGYVVSATFIVAIVDELPGLEGKGVWAFLVMGLAAAPSAILWDLVARRFGNMNALIAASLLQAVGILLPVIEPSLMLTMLGAILFGGTFVGIVCLVLTMAGRFYPSRPAKFMGKMTISFGIAQIVAPAFTGILREHNGDYAVGLYTASATMLVGSVLLLMAKSREVGETPTPEAVNR
ncbi:MULTISPECIES: YbfB/YjiJ family MFS transporter [unclassified Marinobacter]|jgi:predicted MFS family arabinose efflux permease|uniref:YbfB/YjiJ family MFS transporter n=1 Tax=unclassified Marinobacter TaxID=83889 RepID=UPI000D34440D|nr:MULTISPECIES: YbfB/YjiJ family MFS transporter [unclassified Marinobacter]ROQ48647.1 putative MFS family arabinose efflux permease [Marinobacter sp. 3-2]